MSKRNALAGLIGNYGDSDDESGEEGSQTTENTIYQQNNQIQNVDQRASIHPAPVTHCPWSACYDESSGFTYYWNQITNETSWEAPPEYMLALKLAQQHMKNTGSTEVTAEEWQLYQQALLEKQIAQQKPAIKAAQVASNKPATVKTNSKVVSKKGYAGKRRNSSEEEKIELITSYYHSDSESNDESESPVKAKPIVPPPTVVPKPTVVTKSTHKKQKTKHNVSVEYGPSLPPNVDYTVPIGPEMPPEMVNQINNSNEQVKVSEEKEEKTKDKDKDVPVIPSETDDEVSLLQKLKDKAKLLEKLGGEIPTDIQKILGEETTIKKEPNNKAIDESSQESKVDGDIDDLLQEIENNEFKKSAESQNNDKVEVTADGKTSNGNNSPDGHKTPPLEELKMLIQEEPVNSLFPSAMNIQESVIDTESKPSETEVPSNLVAEKKGANLYLISSDEILEKTSKKKLRIDNAVLPERKKLPSYTTKYSQFIEGFSSERTGLGFSGTDKESDNVKSTISYGNGLVFTKGETLNEDKKDDKLDDMTDLVEAKLKFLSQQQPVIVAPVQEMLIQLQTLLAAFRAGALSGAYFRRWASEAGASLRQLEAAAAPAGWQCSFIRSEARYAYIREGDGFKQHEYPAAANTDMDICTTPPPPEHPAKESPPPPPATPPLTAADNPLAAELGPQTPPPPIISEPKKEICDELMSFYSDIAEMEKVTSAPDTASNSPEPPPPVPVEIVEKEKEKDKTKEAKPKKKTKVKISSSIGLKQKTVSSLVAKWQQVADEINSD